MVRQSVVSSNLVSVGYEPNCAVLEIQFNSGGIYQYFGVPPSIYSELLQAPSKGKFFYAYVRDVFSYARIS